VYYPGDGLKVTYSVVPTGDLKTNAWRITARTFTGDTPTIQMSPFQSFHFTRFQYIPALDGFLWFADVRYPAQFWKR
jgi:hypothetical protein